MTSIYHDLIARLTYRSYVEGYGMGAHSEAGLPEMPSSILKSWFESRIHRIAITSGVVKASEDSGNGHSGSAVLHDLLAHYSSAAGRLLLTAFIEGFRSGAISESSSNIVAAGGEETEQLEYASNTSWIQSLSRAKLRTAGRITDEEHAEEQRVEGSMHASAEEPSEDQLARHREALRLFLQGIAVREESQAEENADDEQ